MKPLHPSLLILLLLPLVFPGTTNAGDGNPWTHSFYFENDLFSGTDANYTNGVKYSLISPDLSPHAEDGTIPRKVLQFIHSLPFISESSPQFSHKAEFSFGQNIYTPSDISRRDLIDNDRPYAGWSYIGMAYHRKSHFETKTDFMDTVEVQLGLVGPESFTEETQKFVHELRRLQRPNGWDNQLENEPGLAIIYERKWLFRPMQTSKTLGFDLLSHAGCSLGNIYTYVNTGVEIRFGWNIPETFGVSLIRPAGSTHLVVDNSLSFHAFASLDSRLMLHDIFLDGNTFTESHSVDRKLFVNDLSGGVSITYANMMLTWSQVLRTREFKEQGNDHGFGALTLSFSYPFW